MMDPHLVRQFVRKQAADALCLVAAGVIFGGIAALIVGAW